MNSPDYSYPSGLLARLALAILLLRRRSFRDDAKACIENITPPLQVAGKENIPRQGPCVLTVNHYHRPGFAAQWFALAIAAVLPIDMHWIITGEFTDWGKRYGMPGTLSSRILLKCLAQVYGFTSMPPMPPRPQDMVARAASVRSVLKYIRRTSNPVLGLAPEGYDPPTEVLTRPAPGVGRFALLLAKSGLKFIPVGAYELDDVFHLCFGKQYELSVTNDLSTDEKDNAATQIIMKSIACLLPFHLRGEFA